MYSERDFRPKVGFSDPNKNPDEWVSARAALKLINKVKGVWVPYAALMDLAFDGDVRAWTWRMLVGETSWGDVQIPPLFWHARGSPNQMANWPAGDFGCLVKTGFWVQAFDVQFSKNDIERLPQKAPRRAAPVVETSTPALLDDAKVPAPAPASKGGRSMAATWPDWVAELVNHVHENGIPEGADTAGVDVLLKIVADKLALRGIEGPSRSTAQQTVRAVLLRLRGAGN